MTIVGSDLQGAQVIFGSTQATSATVNTAGTKVIAYAPAQAAGAVTLYVLTRAGLYQGTYTYLAPGITAISPASGPTTGDTKVTITGTDLRVPRSRWRNGGAQRHREHRGDQNHRLLTTGNRGDCEYRRDHSRWSQCNHSTRSVHVPSDVALSRPAPQSPGGAARPVARRPSWLRSSRPVMALPAGLLARRPAGVVRACLWASLPLPLSGASPKCLHSTVPRPSRRTRTP